MPDKTVTRSAEKGSAGARKPLAEGPASRRPAPHIHPAAAFARALSGPASELSGRDILVLQRTAGNRAVAQIIAQKISPKPPSVDRRRGLILQAKLSVGAAGDPYEREADRVASAVMQLSEPFVPDIHRRPSPQEDDEDKMVQRKPLALSISGFVQRTKLKGYEDDQRPLALRPGTPDSAMATPDVETAIKQSQGDGQRLATRVRARMERAFGADFSGVRVHTDSRAERLNRSLGALAFTTGRDIFFRHGAYEPDAPSGNRLLAHELTHVVQQSSAGNTGSLKSVSLKLERTPNHYNVQRQQFGQTGQAFVGDPAAQALRPANNTRLVGDDTEYNSVATDNERYAGRQAAYDRAKRIALQEGNPVRTYHYFANQQAGGNNIGLQIVLTGAGGMNPAARYGYYYDFGDGGLVVEHTQDNQAIYHNINAQGNRTATTNPALHFHAARYDMNANGGTYAGGNRQNAILNLAPPGYNLMRGGHHFYH